MVYLVVKVDGASTTPKFGGNKNMTVSSTMWSNSGRPPPEVKRARRSPYVSWLVRNLPVEITTAGGRGAMVIWWTWRDFKGDDTGGGRNPKQPLQDVQNPVL